MTSCHVTGLTAFALIGLAHPALADVSPFKMPSGNIECYVGTGEGPSDISCTIFQRSNAPVLPRPAACTAGWGNIFSMTSRGPAQMECGNPGGPNTAPGVPVATYGQSGNFDGIVCTSSRQGLECRNADGHGFFLSRAQQKLW
ncbi:MAG: DUF6636 domain-containing protein [Cypionkella sp.]